MKTHLINRQRRRPIDRAQWLQFCDRLTQRLPADEAESWTICVVSDRRMSEMNRLYRGKSGATDVLSFPADAPGEDEELITPPGDEDEKELGDVVISVETAERQAAEQGHTLNHELEVLSIHGYLHLSGYDHEKDDGEMMLLQRQLIQELCGGTR